MATKHEPTKKKNKIKFTETMKHERINIYFKLMFESFIRRLKRRMRHFYAKEKKIKSK